MAMYIRPAGVENTPEMAEKLDRCLSQVAADGRTILAGDFNAKLNKPNDPRTAAFINTLWEFGLHVINDPALKTFNGPMESSTIDVFATNLPLDQVDFLGTQSSLTEGDLLSWHSPVAMSVSVPSKTTMGIPRPAPLSRHLDVGKLIAGLDSLPAPRPQSIEVGDIDQHNQTMVQGKFRRSVLSTAGFLGWNEVEFRQH